MGQADQDYFLDENRDLTTDESKSAFLLVRKGQDIPQDMAEQYGIGKVAQDEAEAPVEAKAAKPSANKKAAPSKNKGVK